MHADVATDGADHALGEHESRAARDDEGRAALAPVERRRPGERRIEGERADGERDPRHLERELALAPIDEEARREETVRNLADLHPSRPGRDLDHARQAGLRRSALALEHDEATLARGPLGGEEQHHGGAPPRQCEEDARAVADEALGRGLRSRDRQAEEEPREEDDVGGTTDHARPSHGSGAEGRAQAQMQVTTPAWIEWHPPHRQTCPTHPQLGARAQSRGIGTHSYVTLRSGGVGGRMPEQNPWGTQTSSAPQVRSPHSAPPGGAAAGSRAGSCAAVALSSPSAGRGADAQAAT